MSKYEFDGKEIIKKEDKDVWYNQNGSEVSKEGKVGAELFKNPTQEGNYTIVDTDLDSTVYFKKGADEKEAGEDILYTDEEFDKDLTKEDEKEIEGNLETFLSSEGDKNEEVEKQLETLLVEAKTVNDLIEYYKGGADSKEELEFLAKEEKALRHIEFKLGVKQALNYCILMVERLTIGLSDTPKYTEELNKLEWFNTQIKRLIEAKYSYSKGQGNLGRAGYLEELYKK